MFLVQQNLLWLLTSVWLRSTLTELDSYTKFVFNRAFSRNGVALEDHISFVPYRELVQFYQISASHAHPDCNIA